MKRMNSKKGFTLVEMVLVVGIIVIMTGVSIVGIATLIKEAKSKEEIVTKNAIGFEPAAYEQIAKYSQSLIKNLDINPGEVPDSKVESEEPTTPADTNKSEVTVDDNNTHEHSYTVTSTTPATCTEAGSKTMVCSCGDEKTEAIPATGHDYKVTSTNNATCTAEGSKTLECVICGDKKTETISATGHNFGDNSETCANCGTSNPDYKAPTTSSSSGNTGEYSASINSSAPHVSISGNKPIQEVVIYVPEGVTITNINDASNGGKYTMEKNDDGGATLTFTASSWAQPSNSLNINWIMWDGPSDITLTYDITYAN